MASQPQNSDACETVHKTFRQYEQAPSRVLDHYRDMRRYQTVDFYQRMEAKYSFANGTFRARMTMEEALEKLEYYVDASDPDLSLPNKLHLLQTAEGIRQAGHPDWFQLVGLIHDMGKIMFLWGTDTDGQGTNQQWALAGDTFVVGCKVPDTVVFPEFNHTNPDMRHLCYSTLYGMYEPHCGLDQLCLAWGHDEYMFRMLVANECSIPREGLDMIRYHSAYPLHSSDGKGAYAHLMKDDDEERLQWIRQFNRFDLYTKDDNKDIRQDMESLWPYYKRLLDKYGLGGTLKW